MLDLIEAEIRRRRMAKAAADYVAFLGAHPEESGDMDAWNAAPLERSPRTRSRRRPEQMALLDEAIREYLAD